ncbi:type II toxin-antitoxin system PemK/MazF family toxin [Candidatus Binatia bacterium]|nr:type II toxin-antitoxin system PemK/MazF family toxin [Candidatus Binatia bacterium]
MKRGDVCWADLSPRSGSEQQGRRPVVIVSRNALNQQPDWKSIIVVPVSTSEGQRARGPTAVPIPAGAGGLTRDSVALCHQITTLDRSKIQPPNGTLPPDVLAAVDRGIKVALNLL